MMVNIVVTCRAVATVRLLGLEYKYGELRKSGLLIISIDRKDAPAAIAILKEEGYDARYDS